MLYVTTYIYIYIYVYVWICTPLRNGCDALFTGSLPTDELYLIFSYLLHVVSFLLHSLHSYRDIGPYYRRVSSTFTWSDERILLIWESNMVLFIQHSLTLGGDINWQEEKEEYQDKGPTVNILDASNNYRTSFRSHIRSI